jgi:putative NADH-flavin reductase
VLAKDAFALVSDDLGAVDVVIDAFSAAPVQAYRRLDLAVRLVSLLRDTQTPRLVFILSAGSLTRATITTCWSRTCIDCPAPRHGSLHRRTSLRSCVSCRASTT